MVLQVAIMERIKKVNRYVTIHLENRLILFSELFAFIYLTLLKAKNHFDF